MSRRVVIDTSVLAWIVDPNAPLPAPPDGVVGDAYGRMQHLVDTLAAERAEIIIPSPVLAEIMSVATRDPGLIMADLDGRRQIVIAPFAAREAVECGLLLRRALPALARDGRNRQLVKFDAQIVATAITYGARTIYTADAGLGRVASMAGLASPALWDLPLPPADPQGALPFSEEG